MRRILGMLLIAVAIGGAGVGFAQSLGDVARQSRAKEKSKGDPKKKVITNDDIPESPNPSPGRTESEAKKESAASTGEPAHERTAAEWRQEILMQLDRVETLEAQISKLQESIRFVTASAYVNGAEYNQYQVKKQQQVARMQTELEQEKKKLGELKVAALKAGMGSAVYDPE